MTDPTWQRHLTRAEGYLELGMIEDAARAVEEIPAEVRSRPEVYAFRVELYTAAQKWDLLEVVSSYLVKSEPELARWWLAKANATFRLNGPWEAERVLITALTQHEHEGELWFDLARMLALQGRVQEAKAMVSEAIACDDKFKLQALEHPDLEPIWCDICSME